MTKYKFTDVEFTDLMAEAVRQMDSENEVGSAWKNTPPGFIGTHAAAHVAVEFLERHLFGQRPEEPRECPTLVPGCDGSAFNCSHMTDEMCEAMSDALEEFAAGPDTTCSLCDEPLRDKSRGAHERNAHKDLWERGPRVWRTVWHGLRDL
jgi:hypothetical protein